MVTSIEELKQSAIPEVDLPPFKSGAPFRAKVKRVGLLDGMFNGKIANPLLNTALKIAGLLDTEEIEKAGEEKVKQSTPEEKLELVKFVGSIVESCLIEPSYRELKENGIDLTDEQMFAIYNCALHEVKEAEKFCESP